MLYVKKLKKVAPGSSYQISKLPPRNTVECMAPFGSGRLNVSVLWNMPSVREKGNTSQTFLMEKIEDLAARAVCQSLHKHSDLIKLVKDQRKKIYAKLQDWMTKSFKLHDYTVRKHFWVLLTEQSSLVNKVSVTVSSHKWSLIICSGPITKSSRCFKFIMKWKLLVFHVMMYIRVKWLLKLEKI